MNIKCPGQDTRFWEIRDIFDAKCPKCEYNVEFFKDEPTQTCKNCGHEFVNPRMNFGCAAYCKYAEQCIGNLPPELLAERDDLLKDRVAVEMKKYFRRDFKLINHTGKVASYAEKIVKQERGNPAVVLASAYLHDIGIPEAERKYSSLEPELHEKEGPPVARAILAIIGAKEEMVEEVCDIISRHHHPGEEETLNFRIVCDADLLANLEERQKKEPLDRSEVARIIEQNIFTETGKELARKALMQ
jgi:putative nucleotidyltransferase with HDIG domain